MEFQISYSVYPKILLLSIPSKQNISSFMGHLKGKSAIMISQKHGNLIYKFGNSNFSATGYYNHFKGLLKWLLRQGLNGMKVSVFMCW